MSLSIGIVGLPNVGKSTLFKALTQNPVDISNYPFCTIEPNVGVVEVPDERLNKLTEISNPNKLVPSVIKFVDVAGLVKGAAQGEGLGNQFLAHLRETDALVHIVRCFQNENIAHIEGEVNPEKDIATVESELALKDLETVEKRMQKVEKEVKQGIKEAKIELELLEKLKESLKKSDSFCNDRCEMNQTVINNLFLLTTKPKIYLLNGKANEIPPSLKQELEKRGSVWLQLELREELDKSELTEEERKELALGDVCLDDLIKKCYKTLNLITFFTIVGKEEARAWPIVNGSTVLQGAGRVHSDFAEHFIKAEVVNWRELYEAGPVRDRAFNGAGSWKRAGELGLLKTVGRDYILKDGDVVEVKHH